MSTAAICPADLPLRNHLRSSTTSVRGAHSPHPAESLRIKALQPLSRTSHPCLGQRDCIPSVDSGLAEKRRAEMPTFPRAAEKVIALNRLTWTNDKHAYQWSMTFSKYVNPYIGSRLVGEVDGSDVLAVLTPVWTSNPETARRVRQRISAVMEWAIAHGYRDDNPADKALSRVLRKMPKIQRHQRAVRYPQMPRVVRGLGRPTPISPRNCPWYSLYSQPPGPARPGLPLGTQSNGRRARGRYRLSA